jgi:hypothetical protein
MPKPYYQTASELRFECTRCGNCCTRPGLVYFPPEDLRRAAGHLGLSHTVFRRRYRLRIENGVYALDPGDAPCPFYTEEPGCGIYEGRPTQCRTWPFWPEVVTRKGSWDAAAKDCEGMNRGTNVTVREIEKSVELCAQAGLPEADPW